ncbi:MAG: GNAT family N-acetyltransferase [Alphaproteobacteria bacterium]|jgi:ribosomal protein S18 acetylase RimI-like enzyme|nr:GNAT family N-acetyltransferase [Alphaproteobacteria bacterium]MBT4082967.1 GNAT family N-acetyltransferase [Alphaproteobacteria bacterium]MBT4543438.1 GNAT family N-acetyltransferase [Alphaproteobacteria bacterium]MBT7745668.1 GNAT family N-acetyltransferase [Alphaproteobacteria bacterium]
MNNISVTRVQPETLDANEDTLALILQASVEAGASIGFVQPCSLDESRAFWRERVFPSVMDGGRILLVAAADDKIAGTVQLVFDMLPSQTHRCEVSKLLVHPDFRKRGIAKMLMAELEQRAASLGKRLITLDTKTGDTAEQIYTDLGYQTAGSIPGYCRSPEGDCDDATTYMYKAI